MSVTKLRRRTGDRQSHRARLQIDDRPAFPAVATVRSDLTVKRRRIPVILMLDDPPIDDLHEAAPQDAAASIATAASFEKARIEFLSRSPSGRY